jgi:hypothetical protein
VLAAQGCAAIETYLKPRARLVFAGAVIGFLLLEYWVVPLRLVPLHNEPPPLYAWLARMPRGLVAEFPMPLPHTLPGDEPVYAYMSTFHWMPLLNGYSGYYPGPYLRRLAPLARLPEPIAIETLKATGVRYVIIHDSGYAADDRTRLVEGLVVHPSVTYLGDFKDGWGEATVFGLR